MPRNSLQNELNAKIMRTSVVMAGLGTNYLYIDQISGYSLINAYNGDWDASQNIPLGIAAQNDHYVLFFQNIKERGYPIRINMIWVKNN